jgi:hypothetical protein
MSAKAVLPELPLSSLRERTKDFLLAFCQREGCTPDEAIRRVMNACADRQMPPPPSAALPVKADPAEGADESAEVPTPAKAA